MPDQISSKKIVIAFPEEIVSIFSDIMKKYGLEESDDEIWDKTLKEQPTKTEKMAEIIKSFTYEESPDKDLPSTLKDSFGISIEQAKKIAKDIEEKIISLTKKSFENTDQEKISSEITTEKKVRNLEKPKPLIKQKTSKIIKKDTYLEPIE